MIDLYFGLKIFFNYLLPFLFLAFMLLMFILRLFIFFKSNKEKEKIEKYLSDLGYEYVLLNTYSFGDGGVYGWRRKNDKDDKYKRIITEKDISNLSFEEIKKYILKN